MARPIICPACTVSFAAAGDLRGKKAFCPQCGQTLIVTSAGVAKISEQKRPVPARTPPARRFNPLWLFFSLLLLLFLVLGAAALDLLGLGHTDESKQVAKNEAQPPAPILQQPPPAPKPQQPLNDLHTKPKEKHDAGAKWIIPPIKLDIKPPQKPKADTPRPVAQFLNTFQLPDSEWIVSLAFSPDGKTLAAGGHAISVFDVASGQCKATLKRPADESNVVYSVAFSPTDNNLLASACAFGGAGGTYRVLLWDIAAGKNTATFDPGLPNSGYLPVAFSPDGKTLALGNGLVQVWDVATGKNTATLSEPRPNATSLAFSPDGKTVAVAGNSTKVLFWDVATRRSTTALELDDFNVFSARFNRDGKTLALGSTRGTKLWRVSKGKETTTVGQITRQGGLFSPVFSPDGKLLAHHGSGNMVCLWDMAGDMDLATVSTFTGSGISAVAFNPDGKILAWAGSEKAIKLWRIDSDAIPGAHLELDRAIRKGSGAK